MFKELFKENKIFTAIRGLGVILGLSFTGLIIYVLILLGRFLGGLV